MTTQQWVLLDFLLTVGLVCVSGWLAWQNVRFERALRRVTAERDAWRADHDALLRGVQDMSAWDLAHPRRDPPSQLG